MGVQRAYALNFNADSSPRSDPSTIILHPAGCSCWINSGKAPFFDRQITSLSVIPQYRGPIRNIRLSRRPVYGLQLCGAVSGNTTEFIRVPQDLLLCGIVLHLCLHPVCIPRLGETPCPIDPHGERRRIAGVWLKFLAIDCINTSNDPTGE